MTRSRLRRWASFAYVATIQAAMGLLAFGLFVYFAVNSPSSAGLLSQVLTGVLPGSFSVRTVQWGPTPGNVRLAGVKISAPDGEQVIAAREVEANLAWLPMIDDLLEGKPGFALRLNRVRAVGADVRLVPDALGRFRLVQAFVDLDEPPKPDPSGRFRLDIDRVDARDTSYFMDIPAVRIRVAQGDLRGRFELETFPNADPHVAWHVDWLRVGEVEVLPSAMRGLPQLPPGTAWSGPVDGDLHRIVTQDLHVVQPVAAPWYSPRLPDTALADARVSVELDPDVVVLGTGAELASSSRSTFLGPLLGPSFDMKAWMKADFRVDLLTGFSAEGDVRGWGKVAGFQTQAVSGRVKVEAGGPGGAIVRVAATDVAVRAYGGELHSPRLDYRFELPDQHVVSGRLTVRDVAPGAMLRSEGVALQGLIPQALDGKLSGEVGAAVRVSLNPLTQPMFDVDVAVDADVDLQRTVDGALYSRELPRLNLRGGVAIGMGPGRGPIVRVNEVVVHTAQTRGPDGASEQHEWLRADGQVDFGAGDTHMSLSAHIPELADVLGPLGIPDVSGMVDLRAADVVGTMERPEVVGEVTARNIRAYGQLVTRAGMKLRLRSGQLSIDGIAIDSPVARVRGSASVQLFGRTLSEAPRQRLLEVRDISVARLDLGQALRRAGIPGIGGFVTVDEGALRLDLNNPKRSIKLSAHLVADDLTAGGETFPRAEARVAMTGTTLSVPEATVQIDAANTARATAEIDLGRRRFDVALDLPMVDVAGFANITRRGLPLQGRVGANIRVAGEQDHLEVQADLRTRGLSYQAIDLGDADLSIRKEADGPAVLTSQKFFRRFKLLEDSQATFHHQTVEQIALHVGTDGPLDPFALLGIERPAGTSVRLESEVTALLDLRPGQPLYRVTVHLPAGGALVDVGVGLPPLRNAGATEIEVLPSGITLGSTFLDLGRHPLELCGELAFADAAVGKPMSLLVFLAGTLDVPRVGPLVELLSALDLRLDILSDPVVAADPRSSCLQSARVGKGRLRVEGPLDDLRVQGAVQTRASRITPRRFGDVQLAAGARVQVASGAGGRMTLTIPREQPLSGTLDDGRFSSWGQAVLVDGAPQSVDLTLQGADLPVNAPKEYRLALSPDLKFRGTHLDDPVERSMLLSGRVHVTEGSYFRSFDTLASVVGGVRERQVETYSQPITQTMPWLQEVVLDLAIEGEDFELTSRFPLGKTDVIADYDLKLRGTLGDMRIYDRARVTEGSGSQITYAINKLVFEVKRGTLDFNGDPTRPYLDLVLEADIAVPTSSTGRRTASGLGQDLTTDTSQTEEIVTVTVQISGFWSDDSKNYDIRFSSNQGDSPADVQYLIATGRRRGDQAPGDLVINTDLLFGEFAAQSIERLLRPLGVFDALALNLDPTSGAVTAEVSKRLGKAIVMAARVETGTRQNYQGSFSFRISDRLSLNGLWRREEFSQTQQTTNRQDVYESKLRYKVPLD